MRIPQAHQNHNIISLEIEKQSGCLHIKIYVFHLIKDYLKFHFLFASLIHHWVFPAHPHIHPSLSSISANHITVSSYKQLLKGNDVEIKS